MGFKRITDTWITVNLPPLIAVFSKVKSLSQSTIADKLAELILHPQKPCYADKLQQTGLCQDRIKWIHATHCHLKIYKDKCSQWGISLN